MTTQSRTVPLFLTVATTAILLAAATVLLWAPGAFGAVTNGVGGVTPDPGVLRWGFVAAALATGLSSLAAGYAVASVGSAGMGALAEKPELMGRVLVLVGLAEGIAIYGLIISILILNRIG
ncbi:MAG: ATP synthase subunit C [Rudaea sp.]